MSTPLIYREALIALRRANAEADAEADRDPYTFDVTASDESVDTFDTSLRGWRINRFLQNPIVLYAHDHTEPVGQASVVRVEEGVLRMTITLAEAGTSAVVDKVRSLRRQGILRGVSVGCMPGAVVVEKDAEGREVLVLADNELLEMSVCAVPSNPNALADLRARAVRPPPPRPPVSTAKKTTAQRMESMPEKPDEKPDEKKDPEKPVEKDAASEAHAVYVAEVSGALAAVEGLDDAQLSAVQSAAAAGLDAAMAKVASMGSPGAEAPTEEAVRSAAATIAALSRDVGDLQGRLRAAEVRADSGERSAIIASAKADHQWSAALAPFLASLPIEQLRTWKRSAPRVAPDGEFRPPTDASPPDVQMPLDVAALAERGWSTLTDMERHSVHTHSPKLAARLRAADVKPRR